MRSLLLLFDAAAVILFVALGRDTHSEAAGLGGILETAAPFLMALVLGWLATRAWRAPASVSVGVGVVALTLAGGMLFRRTIFDEGTALAFVIVATLFLSTCMLGWRAVASRLGRRDRSEVPVGDRS